MRLITDFHLHSKWSYACSEDLTLPNIAKACERKGIGFAGTSDALHPAWQKDIQTLLEDAGNGTFRLKDGSSNVRFMLSTEVSCIYKHGGKARRVHHLILFPTIESVLRLTKSLEERGCNLKADGRPIIGLSSQELLRLVLDADPRCLFIPAHAWTPWFSVFGSKSGYDALDECFGDLTSHIYAIETGLSSDPEMNWRLSALDNVFLVSNSDAHSCGNLGREANVFEMESPSYDELYRILSQHDVTKFVETIEFFPQEGKYHVDGHRECRFFCEPAQTKKLKGICPTCGRPLTIGVLSRVAELADRDPHPSRPPTSASFRSIVPLAELVASVVGVGKTSKKVATILDQLMQDKRTEFGILLDTPESELIKMTTPEVVSAILNMRAGNVDIRPGYDGEYGIIRPKAVEKKSQIGLF